MIELINILYAYWEQNELKLYTTKGLEVIKALLESISELF